MSNSILVGYATQYESTMEVAQAIAETLRVAGLTVDIQPLKEVRQLDGYGAVVMGAPLYMYRWHKDAHRFLKRHTKALSQLPVAVFALGPVQDPHNDEEWENSRSQLNTELAKYPWFKPVTIEMFGGRFDPQRLKFPMSMFAGAEPATDIRDWDAIREWATGLVAKL